MISESCDFDEFVSKTNGRDYHDIIYMADREATAAERRSYHSTASDEEKSRCGQAYAECLKSFITYLRYGVKPACVSADVRLHIDRIRADAMQSKRSAGPRL